MFDNDENEFKPEDSYNDGYNDDQGDEDDVDEDGRYHITEPTKFAKYLGKTVARESGFSVAELKTLISVRQIKSYIKEIGTKEGKTYSLSVNEIDELCLMIHEHIIGIDLTRAAAEGMLEMYWDDYQNTMMFSVLPAKGLEDLETKRIEEKREKNKQTRLFEEGDDDDNTDDK